MQLGVQRTLSGLAAGGKAAAAAAAAAMAQYDLTPVLAKHLDRHLVRLSHERLRSAPGYQWRGRVVCASRAAAGGGMLTRGWLLQLGHLPAVLGGMEVCSFATPACCSCTGVCRATVLFAQSSRRLVYRENLAGVPPCAQPAAALAGQLALLGDNGHSVCPSTGVPPAGADLH